MKIKYAFRALPAFLPLCAFALCVLPLCTLLSAQGVQRQVLKGHLPPPAARRQLAGWPDAAGKLDLAIGLPLRNQAQLTSWLEQLYDPASPNYHHYLSARQFTEKFGPTEDHYQALISFAQSNGLTVTSQHSNRMLLGVRGSVAQIEKAFHTRLRVYQHPTEGRTFYAPEVEPSVDLRIPILHISGLDNYALPARPAGGPRRAEVHETGVPGRSMPQGGSSPPSGFSPQGGRGSGPGGSYIGNDFRAAYAPGVTLNGTGQRVGLLEFDGYYTNDIAAYENQAHMPSVPLTNVLIGGFSGVPGSGANNVNEVSLDIEMVIAMAPGLSQVLVYEADTLSAGEDDVLLNRMATDNLAQQLSSSWNFPTDDITSQIFQQFAAQGQSFFESSGDSLAYDSTLNPIPTPMDLPWLTVVGGTTLTTYGPGGAWASETVWNTSGYAGSGGGISPTYPIPSWQQRLNMSSNGGSATMRNIPDVACVANNVFVIYGNGQVVTNEYGTSCSAPLWAGFAALANQQAAANGLPPVGFLNPILYQIGQSSLYPSAFHDITTGNNTNNDSIHFFAVPGYDLCTGLGTPNGQTLIDLLAPPDGLQILPVTSLGATGPVGGPFSLPVAGVLLTNASLTNLAWSLNTGSSWLAAGATNGTLAPGATANLAVTLKASATALPPGSYTASIAVTNSSSGLVHFVQFHLTVYDPLGLTPPDGFAASGLIGGPFYLGAMNFALSNLSSAPVTWSVTGIPSWLTVSPSAGVLAPGLGASVQESINSNASTLAAGIYSTTLLFSNLTAGTTQSRQATLIIGQPSQTSAPQAYWSSVASSADGTKLVAASLDGIYTSGNSGLNWTLNSPDPSRFGWKAVASSADGNRLMAAYGYAGSTGPIYASTNGGTAWILTLAPTNVEWEAVASSADGSKVAATGYKYSDTGQDLNFIYISSDSGLVWRQSGAPKNLQWWSLASSADGTTLVAAPYSNSIYISTNSGFFFSPTSSPVDQWVSVACSADGAKLVAAASDTLSGTYGHIYTSTNSGASWNLTSAPTNLVWVSVASSADGTKLVAASGSGYPGISSSFPDIGSIYVSADSGLTWAPLGPAEVWTSVATSADGNFILAGTSYGGLYANTALAPSVTAQQWNYVQGSGDPSSGSNLTLLAGSDATLSAQGSGSPPLSYQWLFNGVSIAGATGSALTLANASLSSSGTYSVLVSSPYGSVLSTNALLRVEPALVSTQPASFISTNGAIMTTLNGAVTPGGNGTVVWFQWGTDTNYDHLTPAADVAAGGSQLQFGQPLTGLSLTATYHCRALAANALGVAIGPDVSFTAFGSPFFATSAPANVYWYSLASSADGTKLVALGDAYSSSGSEIFPIYTSTNSGVSWKLTGAPTNSSWSALASSADGTKLGAAVYYGAIYISKDSGATWTPGNAPSSDWTSVASSADGTKWAATASSDANGNPAPIYLSSNSGATWFATGSPRLNWNSVASSADGVKLVAAVYSPGAIYVSSNSGTSWTRTGAPSSVDWSFVVSSADGTKLAAAGGGGNGISPGSIYISTNSGATWTLTSAPTNAYWSSIACSADGTKLAAASDLPVIYTSTDSGATWVATSAPPGNYLYSIACSADGNELVGTASGICIWQTLPTPSLAVASSATNAVLSWIIPSIPFGLQQSADLAAGSWSALAAPPVLNLTNLRNEITVSPSVSGPQMFYRLSQ